MRGKEIHRERGRDKARAKGRTKGSLVVYKMGFLLDSSSFALWSPILLNVRKCKEFWG